MRAEAGNRVAQFHLRFRCQGPETPCAGTRGVVPGTLGLRPGALATVRCSRKRSPLHALPRIAIQQRRAHKQSESALQRTMPRGSSLLCNVLWRAARDSAPDGKPQLNTSALAALLEDAGATGPENFEGLTVPEAIAIWDPLKAVPQSFVEKLVHMPAAPAAQQNKRARVVPPLYPASAGMPINQRQVGPAPVPYSALENALGTLVVARRLKLPPEPTIFARCIRVLARSHGPPPIIEEVGGPRARSWMLELAPMGVEQRLRMMERHAIWIEFQQWSASALQYASAVACWNDAARIAHEAPWPPAPATLHAMVVMCRRAQPERAAVGITNAFDASEMATAWPHTSRT